MQINTYEHVFPLKKTCGISPLEHQASGILEKYFLLKYSLPWRSLSPLEDLSPPWGGDKLFLWCDLSLNDKLWCDLSLPLWHQFPRRVFWNLSNGFGPRDTEQSNDKNVMLVEYKIHWVELDQKKHRIMWQTVFPVIKSVAPSELLRLDRKDSVG